MEGINYDEEFVKELLDAGDKEGAKEFLLISLSWSNRGEIACFKPEFQKKIFEAQIVDFYNFSLFSEEAQINILNNLNDQTKNILLSKFKQYYNYFFWCSKRVKELANKNLGIDIEINKACEVWLKEIHDFDLQDIYDKIFGLTCYISAGYCQTKTAYLGLKMYQQKSTEYVESEFEKLKEEINKTRLPENKIRYSDDASIPFSHIYGTQRIECLDIAYGQKGMDNEYKHVGKNIYVRCYGFKGLFIPFVDIVMSGKPVGIHNSCGNHIQPLDINLEKRKAFIKYYLELMRISFYRGGDNHQSHEIFKGMYFAPGSIEFCHRFLINFLANKETDQIKKLETKLKEIFKNVPDKYKSYKTMQLCDFVFKEFDKFYIDNYEPNKISCIDKWLFEKIDNFSDQFLSIYKSEAQEENKNNENNDLKAVIEQKNNEINNLKEQLKKTSEKNKSEGQNELKKELAAAKNELRTKDIKIKELEAEKKDKSDEDKDKTKGNSDSNLKYLERKNIFGIIGGSGELIFGTASFFLLLVTQTINPISLLLIFITIAFDAKGITDIVVSAISMHKIRKTLSTQKIAHTNENKNKSNNIR